MGLFVYIHITEKSLSIYNVSTSDLCATLCALLHTAVRMCMRSCVSVCVM